MAAALGAVVRIAYDWWSEEEPPTVGDFLYSSGGSLYLILTCRPGRASERLNLTCMKMAADQLPADARVAALFWNRR